ncbi:MAG: PaaI family thioesterase [Flavobacteriales bacterium]|nr:PaaI family thioesterase [Flavobacteriales bacterium]
MSFDKEKALALMNGVVKDTLMETLNIEFIDAGEDFLTAKMPVDSRVYQPMGILHGGATVALAETVGSAASRMIVRDGSIIKGIEINANHLKSVSTGNVYATAKVIHQGRTTHLWEIRVVNDQGQLISICKLTNIVLPKKNP